MAIALCLGLAFASPDVSALQLAARDDGPVGDVSGPDMPWSGPVREAQRVLADLGLYRGPLDGRLSSAFEQAMLAYESRYGISGKGLGGADLLSHIQALSPGARIRETLEQARHEQIERARAVLLRDGATRDLMQPIADDRADPERQAGACLRLPTAPCLLAEAIETAKDIERDDYRDWAFRDILRVQAALGDGEGARASIRRLSDPRLKILAMRETVEGLARQGQLDAAAELAITIPDPRNGAAALSSLAAAHAARGDRQATQALAMAAQELMGEIDDIGVRIELAGTLARHLDAAGDSGAAMAALSTAHAVLADAPAGAVRDAATAALARAFAELRAATAAAALIESLSGAVERQAAALGVATGLARSGMPTAVGIGNLTGTDGRYRLVALAELARAHAVLGEREAVDAALERALAIAEATDSPFARDYGLGRILVVHAAVGDVPAALRTAARIGNAAVRSRALWSGAQDLRAAGYEDGAARLEAASHAAAAMATSAFDRIAMACEKAAAMAAGGRIDAARGLVRTALATLESIETDWWRARSLAAIALALAAVDDPTRH